MVVKSHNLHSFNYLRTCTREEIFKYIRKLHKIVRKQQRRLQRYKHKLKFLKQVRTPEPDHEKNDVDKNKETKPKTFLEEIKEAAESAQKETDFIYEPTSGLYYDQRTGYYYNAEYGLYYDGATGCYYRYNQEKQEFEFHSQVQIQTANNDQVSDKSFLNILFKQFSKLNINQMRENALGKFVASSSNENTPFLTLQDLTNQTRERSSPTRNGTVKRKLRRERRSKIIEELKKVRKRGSEEDEDFEDGEIASSSETDSNDITVISDSGSGDIHSKYEDVAKRYPPSLRIIVQDTNLTKLKIGTLFIITFKGGSLGREGTHDVIIPDVNVSKFHLKFTYDETESTYKCIDLGSRNGTILNGTRMSNAKQESEPQNVVHGSVLQLSQTKLLCHIHSGNSTCGHCEPGLVTDQQTASKFVSLTHKEQLKVLQKRYGLENEKYVVTENKLDPHYSDRAAERRVKIGSTNEYEKTEAASLETEIANTNKGFKMLSKLGWNKGEALGKGQGLLEPIKLVSNEGTTGLGCDKPSVSIQLTKKNQKKTESLQKTQERYRNSKLSNIFYDSDDASSSD